MYNGWPRTDLFDTVLRQHLIIKDANISPGVVETEKDAIGFCLVGGLVQGSICSAYPCSFFFFQIFQISEFLDERIRLKVKKKIERIWKLINRI